MPISDALIADIVGLHDDADSRIIRDEVAVAIGRAALHDACQRVFGEVHPNFADEQPQ